MKITNILAGLILSFAPSLMCAQTDVTSQYLNNANFDDSSSWATADINSGTTLPVNGWSVESTGDTWFYGGAIGYNSNKKMNSALVTANPSGGSDGGALALSIGWGCSLAYKQQTTLPAGRYKISYKACNAGTDGRQAFNRIGFVESNGSTHYGSICNFIPNEWMEESITLEFKQETTGYFSVGIGAVSGGSGNNAKLFVDGIKLEAYNASETMMPGNSITAGNWTGQTGPFGNKYQEHYQEYHYTGDVMTNTTPVANGTYEADIIFQSHMAWVGKVAEDGSLNSYIKAGDVTHRVGIVNNTALLAYEPITYHFDDIQVNDGSLVITVGNSAQGSNWLTVGTPVITQMTTPMVSYGAFALPSTAVVKDYWYQLSIPIPGRYVLSCGDATVSYTQNASTTTDASFSTATDGDFVELTAGTLYLKSSAASTIKFNPTNYSYHIGQATADRTSLQPGQTVTLTYKDMATNDEAAKVVTQLSGITLGNQKLEISAEAKGFRFVVPDLEAGQSYTLSIPANAIGYEGHESNEAQTISFTTAAVFDGIYFLANEEGQYLSRGSDWGTRAIVDDWGLPLTITTDTEGISSIRFTDTDYFLFHEGSDAWCDKTTADDKTKWSFTLSDGKYLLGSTMQTGKYIKKDAGNARIFTDGTNTGAIRWTLETPAGHLLKMEALKASLTALSTETEGLQSKRYATSTPTKTGEQFQGGGAAYNNSVLAGGSIEVYPGIYEFSILAFHRMGSNDAAYPWHKSGADCPPVYAFFGDTKVQLLSVFDSHATNADNCITLEGVNYPNSQGSALNAFLEGHYRNSIWVRVDEKTTLNYGIQNQGEPKAANARWTCWATDGIQITRYYDPQVDGLDEEDQQKKELIDQLTSLEGDRNKDGKTTLGDLAQAIDELTTGKSTRPDIDLIADIVLGRKEAALIDKTWTYADVDANVYAEQMATENAEGPAYMINSAVCPLTGKDVKDEYKNLEDITTLNITTTLSGVKSVSIMAADKTAIAGPMMMKYEGSTATITYPTGQEQELTYARYLQSDVVTVTGDDAGTYTAYLQPRELAEGVIVTVRTGDGMFYSQTFTGIEPGMTNNLNFTETRNSGNWMATIPGNTPWSMVSTPGSHDAATSTVSGTTSSYAKCQSDDMATQLANGVRCFDIRPGYKLNSTINADNLYIYHSSYNTNVLYKDAIKIFADYLDQHPTEAITIIMVKENNSGTDRSSEMWSVVNAVQEQYKDYMHILDRSSYTLDDFRGKICYINRTGTPVPYSTQITKWPDDTEVTNYSCTIGSACSANVQDAYNSNGEAKQNLVKSHLNTSSANTDRSHFHINYTSSAYKLFGSAPQAHAEKTNPVIASYLSNGSISGPTGYVMSDFIGSASASGKALLKAIIEQNYRYVYQGRTRNR